VGGARFLPSPDMNLPSSHRENTLTRSEDDLVRASTRFGLLFAVCQIAVMIVMATVVLPRAGSPADPAVDRGERVLDAAALYRYGNYVFMLAGTVLLGFLGAVQARLRAVDGTGVLATVAVAAGILLTLIWPLGALLHDVALETASAGADPRILAGWDAVAPFSLAFSVLPRLFFVGALVMGLRVTGAAPWLARCGLVVMALSLVGSGTLVAGDLFPVLAISTLGYELWVGALAWHWLRAASRRPDRV
jgi:hypothetical protein